MGIGTTTRLLLGQTDSRQDVAGGGGLSHHLLVHAGAGQVQHGGCKVEGSPSSQPA